MTTHFITTDLTTPLDAISDLSSPGLLVANGDEVVISQNTFVGGGNSGVNFRDTDFSVTVLGGLYGRTSAITMALLSSDDAPAPFDYRVTVGANGSINSDDGDAMFLGVFSTLISDLDAASRAYVNNAGHVASANNGGIFFQTVGEATLINSGTVSAGQNPSFGNAVSFTNVVYANLTNTGTIIRTSTDGGSSNAAAVGFEMNTQNAYLLNTGLISDRLTAVASDATISEEIRNAGSIYGDVITANIGGLLVNEGSIGGDIDTRNGDDTITNSGTITGDIDFGDGNDVLTNTGEIAGNIEFSGGFDAASELLINQGTITGEITYGTGSVARIDNSGTINGGVDATDVTELDIQNLGTITGDILAGAQDDLIVNDGIIGGDIILNAGDDIYDGTSNSIVLGEVLGGIGEDTLIGGSNADYLDGGDDNDRLFGRGGDDDIRGGLGSDFMSAGAGDDFMLGDDGADRMFGGGGEDTLQGGRDLDTIRGGDGADEINGGRSADVLRGGAGADTFLYQFRQDSTLNLSDTIQDFQIGVDVIDVAATASQLSFIGSAAFSGSGNEVRYEIGGNGKTFVEVDTDADGTADMRILLTAVGVLTEDDFVL